MKDCKKRLTQKNETPKNLTFKQVDGYKGQVNQDGQKHGYGQIEYDDGAKYKGQWRNDAYQGRGVLTYSNGDVFTGEFANDLAEGFGILLHEDGSIYVGFWAQDQ